jgi:hypothetical protein
MSFDLNGNPPPRPQNIKFSYKEARIVRQSKVYRRRIKRRGNLNVV